LFVVVFGSSFLVVFGDVVNVSLLLFLIVFITSMIMMMIMIVIRMNMNKKIKKKIGFLLIKEKIDFIVSF
jgi:hypothetical protein